MKSFVYDERLVSLRKWAIEQTIKVLEISATAHPDKKITTPNIFELSDKLFSHALHYGQEAS